MLLVVARDPKMLMMLSNMSLTQSEELVFHPLFYTSGKRCFLPCRS